MKRRFIVVRNDWDGITKQQIIERYHKWLDEEGIDKDYFMEIIQHDLFALSRLCHRLSYSPVIADIPTDDEPHHLVFEGRNLPVRHLSFMEKSDTRATSPRKDALEGE